MSNEETSRGIPSGQDPLSLAVAAASTRRARGCFPAMPTLPPRHLRQTNKPAADSLLARIPFHWPWLHSARLTVTPSDSQRRWSGSRRPRLRRQVVGQVSTFFCFLPRIVPPIPPKNDPEIAIARRSLSKGLRRNRVRATTTTTALLRPPGGQDVSLRKPPCFRNICVTQRNQQRNSLLARIHFYWPWSHSAQSAVASSSRSQGRGHQEKNGDLFPLLPQIFRSAKNQWRDPLFGKSLLRPHCRSRQAPMKAPPLHASSSLICSASILECAP